jgi:Tol biopolymer transport system component
VGAEQLEIAYIGTGAIVIRNISTGVERRVALDTAHVSDLRWSPDGTKFLFTQTLLAPGSTNVSGSEIRVVDATTGAPVTSGNAPLRFTAGVANFQPSWSPDSQTVLWATRTDSALPFQIVSQSLTPGATPVPVATIGGNTEPAWAE